MTTYLTTEQAVELARKVAAANGDTLKDVPEKETVELLYGLCNAAIAAYIDSLAEGLPEPEGELWEYKTKKQPFRYYTRDQLLACIARAKGEK